MESLLSLFNHYWIVHIAQTYINPISLCPHSKSRYRLNVSTKDSIGQSKAQQISCFGGFVRSSAVYCI